MPTTNVLNLPEPLVRTVSRHSHERQPGRISVTEMIQPSQIRALSLLHDGEITEDASDRIWALLGTLLHGVLERNAQGLKDTISEEELSAKVLGWQVVGHYDLSEMVLDGECLTDWKLTSVWSVKDGVKREWEEQLNCYAQLIRLAGRRVDQLQIVAIGRDWSKLKAKYDSSYPQQQVKVMAVPLWTPEQAVEFMEDRVALHQRGEQGNYDECTNEERWAKPDRWAVSKKHVKRAIRVYETLKEAERHVEADPSLVITHRPGESTRCESYCSVAPHCEQWKRIQDATT